MRSYDIFWNQDKVGTANVRLEGLYSHIYCRCKLDAPGIYRVIIKNDLCDLALGVCIPTGREFVITKKVPTKHLKGDNLRFHIQSENETEKDQFLVDSPCIKIPISSLRKMKVKMMGESTYLVIT